jgi:fluoride exporter
MKALWDCLAIGGAGFCGALARYGVGVVIGRWFATSFPIATLLINVTGSLFLGWFYTFMRARYPQAETLRLAIATGFVGAYTTFSTYMYESDQLLAKGASLQAGTYLVGSIALGLGGVWIGIRLATMMGR